MSKKKKISFTIKTNDNSLFFIIHRSLQNVLSKIISTLNPLNTLLIKNHISKYSPKVTISKILLYRVQTSFACFNYIFCSNTELLKRFGINFVLCSVSQVEPNTVALCSRSYVQNLGHPRFIVVGTFARFLPNPYR